MKSVVEGEELSHMVAGVWPLRVTMATMVNVIIYLVCSKCVGRRWWWGVWRVKREQVKQVCVDKYIDPYLHRYPLPILTRVPRVTRPLTSPSA